MSANSVLYDKPIDQWKVSELKEELKRRKLTTKGLKDDLVRRLNESIQTEIEIANTSAGKDLAHHPEPIVQYQDAPTMPGIDEKSSVFSSESDKKDAEVNNDVAQPNVDVNTGLVAQEQVIERDITLEPVIVAETTVEINREVTMEEFSPVVSEVTKLNSSGQKFQNNGAQNKSEAFDIQMQNRNLSPSHQIAKLNSSNLETQNEDTNPHHEKANLNSFALETQVFEVSKVTSDSVSTDNVSINEKIELKDNIIADDVKLEFDVKHGKEEPSSGHVDLDDGNLQTMDVQEPQENEVKVEETVTNAENPNIAKKIDTGDVEFSEKLNLDQSSLNDSRKDDLLESKQIESKSLSVEAGDKIERNEVTVVREVFPVDAMVDDTGSDGKIEQIMVPGVASTKRKPNADQATVGNSETTKRQRRWNNEGPKVLEPNNDNISPSITPRGTFQSNAKRTFSRSDSMASVETPKERVVPPSSKPPTSALRIDHFLRPFTLKAVQELLGKTGTITNFWMDHIKTHCYVSFSSIEEAIETRNAVYNLQWPTNGGHLLIAEFVEPHEVQKRVEAPLSSAAPVNTGPILAALPVPMQSQPYPRVQGPILAALPVPMQSQPYPRVQGPFLTALPVPMRSQPYPRVQVQRQAPQPLPPVVLAPPTPVSKPPVATERALPPPPPLPERVTLPEKVAPPVTLDDLFMKTKATPRIYYLPLSDEQVKAKENVHGKPPSSLQVLLVGRNSEVAGSMMDFTFPRRIPHGAECARAKHWQFSRSTFPKNNDEDIEKITRVFLKYILLQSTKAPEMISRDLWRCIPHGVECASAKLWQLSSPTFPATTANNDKELRKLPEFFLRASPGPSVASVKMTHHEFDDIIPASAATIAAGAFTAATINIHFIWCIVGDQDFFSLPIRA
ncbi:Apoptotic chromatin condensation inducer in the nucleus [Heracleum sosnowskyi]|uniref:Apoptotic chromatin condensation inducer in the nucleus n=1 Tax=Heracleum sosnowskyi TaxID=360622 RepID=A0AAD8MH29_9APIA|nr:Apoptotic chromatin condensation inducer in the nucleus [Heracleum sosnowskyi]